MWEDGAPQRYTVLERDALLPGARIAPRTIVEQEDATLVVPAGWSGEVAAADIVVLTREEGA